MNNLISALSTRIGRELYQTLMAAMCGPAYRMYSSGRMPFDKAVKFSLWVEDEDGRERKYPGLNRDINSMVPHDIGTGLESAVKLVKEFLEPETEPYHILFAALVAEAGAIFVGGTGKMSLAAVADYLSKCADLIGGSKEYDELPDGDTLSSLPEDKLIQMSVDIAHALDLPRLAARLVKESLPEAPNTPLFAACSEMKGTFFLATASTLLGMIVEKIDGGGIHVSEKAKAGLTKAFDLLDLDKRSAADLTQDARLEIMMTLAGLFSELGISAMNKEVWMSLLICAGAGFDMSDIDTPVALVYIRAASSDGVETAALPDPSMSAEDVVSLALREGERYSQILDMVISAAPRGIA